MGWTTPSILLKQLGNFRPPPLPELTEPHLLEFFLRGFPTFSVGIRDQFFHTMLTQPGKSLLPFSTGLGKKVVPSGLFHKIRFWGTHTDFMELGVFKLLMLHEN